MSLNEGSPSGKAPAGKLDALAPATPDIWNTVHKIVRSIALILILNAVFKYAGSYIKAPLKTNFAKPEYAKASKEDMANHVTDPTVAQRDYSIYPRNIIPLWTPPTTLDLDLYISEKQQYDPSGEEPFISIKSISTGDWKDVREVTKTLTFPDSVLHKNGSLYAHLFTYMSPESAAGSHEPDLPQGIALRSSHLLTRFMPKKRDTAVKKLIGTTSEESDLLKAQNSKSEIISFYHTNFSVALVGDAGKIPFDSVHPVIRPFITLEPTRARDVTGVDGYYLPIVYPDSFWLLQDHMYPINASVPDVPFHFRFNQVSMMKMQVFNSLDAAFKQQAETMGGSGAEFEEIKRIFLETNVWLLGITV